MVAGSKGAENLTRHTNLPVLNFKFCFTFPAMSSGTDSKLMKFMQQAFLSFVLESSVTYSFHFEQRGK